MARIPVALGGKETENARSGHQERFSYNGSCTSFLKRIRFSCRFSSRTARASTARCLKTYAKDGSEGRVKGYGARNARSLFQHELVSSPTEKKRQTAAVRAGAEHDDGAKEQVPTATKIVVSIKTGSTTARSRVKIDTRCPPLLPPCAGTYLVGVEAFGSQLVFLRLVLRFFLKPLGRPPLVLSADESRRRLRIGFQLKDALHAERFVSSRASAGINRRRANEGDDLVRGRISRRSGKGAQITAGLSSRDEHTSLVVDAQLMVP